MMFYDGDELTYDSSLGGVVEFREIPGTDRSINQLGVIVKTKTKKVLTPQINDHGYKHIAIKINGKKRDCGIHRLEALAFGLIKSIDDPKDIDHKDGNKINNDLDNLQAITHKENCHKRKGKVAQIKVDCYLYGSDKIFATYDSLVEAAKATGNGEGNISHMVNGTMKLYNLNGYVFRRHGEAL